MKYIQVSVTLALCLPSTQHGRRVPSCLQWQGPVSTEYTACPSAGAGLQSTGHAQGSVHCGLQSNPAMACLREGLWYSSNPSILRAGSVSTEYPHASAGSVSKGVPACLSAGLFCATDATASQNGVIKLYKELRCPLDDFELVLWTSGASRQELPAVPTAPATSPSD
ncbi:unnamed protein product [Boreogadus saida]